MANVRITNALAIQMCDAVVDAVDAGPAAGTLEIRTGAPPADCEAADSGTLLATLTFSDPAFGNAVDNTPGAIATANAITSDTSAAASGAAGHFRVKDSVGNVVFQGDITATSGGGDIELDDINIVIGGTVAVSSLTFEVEET